MKVLFEGDLELRRLNEVPFDAALIDGALHRLSVFRWKRRRQADLDANAIDVLPGCVAFRCNRKSEPLGVHIALLTESQGIKPRTCPDRGEKEIEGRRSGARPSLSDGLVRANPKTFVMRLDAQTAGKLNVHKSILASGSAARLMQTDQHSRGVLRKIHH